ncbi:MAG: Hpt domain-containing protein [Planctomycetota bacterium]
MNTDLLTKGFVSETRPLVAGLVSELRKARGTEAGPEGPVLDRLSRNLHRIRSAAGFLGFTNVERLARSLELVLDLCGQGELESGPRLWDSVLDNAEVLGRALEDLETIDEYDLRPQVQDLDRAVHGSVQNDVRKSLEDKLCVAQRADGGDLGCCFVTSRFELERASRAGLGLYRLVIDLMRFYTGGDRGLLTLIADLTDLGLILDSEADLSGIGDLDQSRPTRMPLFVLLASREPEERIRARWSLDAEHMQRVRNPMA